MGSASGISAPDERTPGSAGREAIIIDRRTALVGGGATGIGRATAEKLAGAGLRVVISGRREELLRATAEQIQDLSGMDVEYVVSDLADPQAAARLVDEVESRVGAVDVLVVNAGGPPPGRILEVDDPAWYRGLELLLLGPLRLARPALPRMAARGFGRVIVVTSTAVRKPEPDLAVSVVARSAVTAAAKLLALEYAADGVTVNCVAPGATATARRGEILAGRARATRVTVAELDRSEAAAIPAGRPGAPAEIADAIGFLASEAAGYINGTVLTVDGGRTEAIW
jgi:3-oxoacyl-[acyl-carrier protein] reductase